MAIRRCPYCKAIIDGVAEYCSNCGTQLLFPEDEFKEEEIPGDRIVEEEEKEEETLEAEEAESEKGEPSPESEEREEGKEEEILEAKGEKLEKDEIEVTPPQVEEIDIKAAEALRMREARELVKKETQKLWESVGTGEEERLPDVEIEFPLPPEEEEAPESGEELKVEEEKEEIDLRSIRLRRTPDTEEREKEEVERFVESVKAERGKEALRSEEEIPPSEEIEMEEREEIDLRSIRIGRTPDTEEREKVEIERFVESIKKERERVKEYFTPEDEIPPPPKEMGEETSEIKDRIPPWAEKIKEEPPQELEDKEKERDIEKTVELGEDFQEKEIKTPVDEPPPPTDEPLPEEDKPLSPTGEPLPPTDELLLSEKEIGFPEEVDQKVPFAREIREKRKRAVRRRRSGYYAWLKARAFDFVFIAAFSLICLGLASRLMEVSLFRLISASGPPVLVFYFVLLLFYFGFFILFLGETPGDRLFPRD
ncbi:MAG: hypothetical protein GQ476_03925 [Candidatus Aminicenantes bacterium]|nr:hypothetical protein [Candidatus Aminicenantes bacterium]